VSRGFTCAEPHDFASKTRRTARCARRGSGLIPRVEFPIVPLPVLSCPVLSGGGLHVSGSEQVRRRCRGAGNAVGRIPGGMGDACTAAVRTILRL
jgi:hypothetical protein